MRGEQDEMLQVENQIPGFGGFFVDEGQRMVVYLKSSTVDLAFVRDVLARQYSHRTEPRVREVMGHLSETKVIQGQYSLSELIAVENSIARSFDRIPGFSAVGVSILRNRVKLGFVDAADVAPGMSTVRSLGVPFEAVIPEVWGRIHAAAAWGNTFRPMFGGLMISIENRSVDPDTLYGRWLCSYGFTVTDSLGRSYLMTAAHCANGFHGLNGATGDTVFQGSRNFAPTSVATFTINPSWRIYPCPIGADFCPLADAALAQFLNGATGSRGVGTSMYEGLNGSPSINSDVNPGSPYPLTTPVTPEWVDSTPNGIHKSGYNTGTTTGQINVPSTQGGVVTDWGSPTYATRTLWFTNLTQIDHIGWGHGDSGGPVFAGNGGAPYYPLGTFIAGSGHQNPDTRVCDAGVQCRGFFVRWGAIETQLGIGPLNPATVQPPPSGLTGVTITGPRTVNGCTVGTWTATPSGGTYPITYIWDVENRQFSTNTVNQLNYTNTGAANAIVVEVVAMDGRGTSLYAQFKTGVVLPGAC
jgi:hypothetical protein